MSKIKAKYTKFTFMIFVFYQEYISSSCLKHMLNFVYFVCKVYMKCISKLQISWK